MIWAASSGELSVSTDKTVLTICTSFLKSSGNIGRIGLSIIRAARVAASVGRPSLLIKPPGILATCISKIPFDGPIAGVKVGRVNGEFVINPTPAELEVSDIV